MGRGIEGLGLRIWGCRGGWEMKIENRGREMKNKIENEN